MAVIAVDGGGTKLAFGRFRRPDTAPIRAGSVPTPSDTGRIADAIVDGVESLFDGTVTAIGAGIAGLVDHRAGNLLWMPHAGGPGAPIAMKLTDTFGVPVGVDNDANLAALAEARLGAGRGARTVLAVTLGTGIGGGLVIDGNIERGSGYLGEVGHMVVDPGGPACKCGGSGCWETLASGSALDRAARETAAADPQGVVASSAIEPSGRHLVQAAREGDPAAGRALREAAVWLGLGLANLVAVLDPEIVVIAGGVAAVGDLLLEPARLEMNRRVPGAAYRRLPPVLAAHYGGDAGLVGAAIMAEEVA